MIQEIEPHIYDNVFEICSPVETDYVTYVEKRSILLNEDGSLISYGDVEGIDSSCCKFLFKMDDRNVFMLDRAPENVEKYRFFSAGDIRTLENEKGFPAITAIQFTNWYRDHKFCSRCATPLVDSDKERALVCPNCKKIEYPRINPAIIVAVSDGNDLLMIRGKNSTTGNYHLVAGFVEVGQTLEETVVREVREEVGLKVKNIRYIASQPWSFSDSLMLGFRAELDGERTPFRLQESEVSDAKWVPREEIPEASSYTSIGSTLIMGFKHKKI